jgi:hypothetical protein
LLGEKNHTQFCGKLDKLITLETNLTEKQISDYFADSVEYYYEYYPWVTTSYDSGGDYLGTGDVGSGDGGGTAGQRDPSPPKKKLKLKTTSKLTLSPDDVSKVIDKIMCSVTADLDTTLCDCPQACESQYYVKSLSQAPWPHPSYQVAFYNTYINGTDIDTDLDLGADILAHEAAMTKEGANHNDEKLIDLEVIKKNFLQLNIFFDENMYTDIHDKSAINVSVLLATIGGALNLWIGITIMTLVELFELLYNLFALAGNTEYLHSKKVSPPDKGQIQPPSAMTEVKPIGIGTAW